MVLFWHRKMILSFNPMNRCMSKYGCSNEVFFKSIFLDEKVFVMTKIPLFIPWSLIHFIKRLIWFSVMNSVQAETWLQGTRTAAQVICSVQWLPDNISCSAEQSWALNGLYNCLKPVCHTTLSIKPATSTSTPILKSNIQYFMSLSMFVSSRAPFYMD